MDRDASFTQCQNSSVNPCQTSCNFDASRKMLTCVIVQILSSEICNRHTICRLECVASRSHWCRGSILFISQHQVSWDPWCIVHQEIECTLFGISFWRRRPCMDQASWRWAQHMAEGQLSKSQVHSALPFLWEMRRLLDAWRQHKPPPIAVKRRTWFESYPGMWRSENPRLGV